MQDAITNSRGTRVAIVAGQCQRARTGLGEITSAAEDTAECQGKGLGINGSSTVERDVIAKGKPPHHRPQRGVGLHGQRARAKRVIVADTKRALLQARAAGIGVIARKDQSARAGLDDAVIEAAIRQDAFDRGGNARIHLHNGRREDRH